jgi:hypothetical protein
VPWNKRVVDMPKSEDALVVARSCAIGWACLNRDMFSAEDPKNPSEACQKIKIDRQIIAIFKVPSVENIYIDDAGMAKRALLCVPIPIATHQLIPPTADYQIGTERNAPDDIPEPADGCHVE